MEIARIANKIFEEAVKAYHDTDNVDAPEPNPYHSSSIESLLFAKNWTDAVQWHLEDLVRDPDIDPVEALAIRRRIDNYNQRRTDLVEQLDEVFRWEYRNVPVRHDATINTESPAWAIDRLSILHLKIWHMREVAFRSDADARHRDLCRAKLDILAEQRNDLSRAIDTLMADIKAGRKYIKVYRQMKMYNDPTIKPVLYNKQPESDKA